MEEVTRSTRNIPLEKVSPSYPPLKLFIKSEDFLQECLDFKKAILENKRKLKAIAYYSSMEIRKRKYKRMRKNYEGMKAYHNLMKDSPEYNPDFNQNDLEGGFVKEKKKKNKKERFYNNPDVFKARLYAEQCAIIIYDDEKLNKRVYEPVNASETKRLRLEKADFENKLENYFLPKAAVALCVDLTKSFDFISKDRVCLEDLKPPSDKKYCRFFYDKETNDQILIKIVDAEDAINNLNKEYTQQMLESESRYKDFALLTLVGGIGLPLLIINVFIDFVYKINFEREKALLKSERDSFIKEKVEKIKSEPVPYATQILLECYREIKSLPTLKKCFDPDKGFDPDDESYQARENDSEAERFVGNSKIIYKAKGLWMSFFRPNATLVYEESDEEEENTDKEQKESSPRRF